MPTRSRAVSKSLTAYEKQQVAEIAVWKSKPINPVAEAWNMVVLQAAKAVTFLVPDVLVRSAIELSYSAAHKLAPPQSIARQAGVKDVRELRKSPLEKCDRLTHRVSFAARTLAAAEGAATGAGGAATTLIDVPLLFASALRTIIRIGQCYGYPGGEPRDRYFNLGVLTIATAGSVATRLQRLDQLKDLEELLVEETQVDMIRSELLSFIFQLEVFEEIPGIGIASGALLNLSFMHRVDVTVRRVFQERGSRITEKAAVSNRRSNLRGTPRPDWPGLPAVLLIRRATAQLLRAACPCLPSPRSLSVHLRRNGATDTRR